MSLRKGTALLARDSQYLYLGIISELPNATETKLTISDRVFFNVTSPTGKEVAVELNSNGEGCLSAGMLQTFKSQKGNYHHFIALPWHCFGISAPEAGSIWKIQMGRLFQSPNERALLNLKRPALVRMEDGVPALDFKVGKSSWTTGYFPQMVWKIRNLSPQTMEIEGKAEITWIGNPILFHKKENLAVGAATEFSQLLSGGSENDLRTCNMEFQFNGKPFFRRTIDMGGAGIAWQTAGAEATQFRIGVYPSLDTVKACVSNRNPDQLKDFDSAVFQVVDDQGKRYCESMVQKEKGVFYSVWHLPRLKTGKYYVTGTLLGERGKAEPLVRQPFEYRRFEWENNAIGLDRIVIPPFKPLAVDRLNKRVNATMTGYAFGRKLLDSVTSEGKELLTTPVAFSVNGKELSLEGLDFIDTAPDRVRLAGSGTVGPLKVKIHYDIDYDGLVWVTMDLDSGNWTLIHSMSLEIPMKSEYARFLHATCAQTRKHPNIALADKEGVVFSSRTDAPNNFLSYIWYGGFSKGLCWCTETEKEWS
ncbi:MAG: hypothetical protein IJJ33_20995, partial [Victivallales bacterium]|nr:hypothetical protein [Victivallales bacterium]